MNKMRVEAVGGGTATGEGHMKWLGGEDLACETCAQFETFLSIK